MPNLKMCVGGVLILGYGWAGGCGAFAVKQLTVDRWERPNPRVTDENERFQPTSPPELLDADTTWTNSRLQVRLEVDGVETYDKRTVFQKVKTVRYRVSGKTDYGTGYTFVSAASLGLTMPFDWIFNLIFEADFNRSYAAKVRELDRTVVNKTKHMWRGHTCRFEFIPESNGERIVVEKDLERDKTEPPRDLFVWLSPRGLPKTANATTNSYGLIEIPIDDWTVFDLATTTPEHIDLYCKWNGVDTRIGTIELSDTKLKRLRSVAMDQSMDDLNSAPIPPKLTVLIEVSPKGQVSAGDEITAAITVRNTGKGTAYQVTGQVDSAIPGLSQQNLRFGKLAKGESFTQHVQATVPIGYRSDSAMIAVQLDEGNDEAPDETLHEVALLEHPRPHFQASITVFDDRSGGAQGDGDGLIEPGEVIEVEVLITNTGPGVSRDTVVQFRIPDDQAVEWYDHEDGNLYSLTTTGQKRHRFGLRIKNTAKAGAIIGAVIVVRDQRLNEWFEHPLTIVVSAPTTD